MHLQPGLCRVKTKREKCFDEAIIQFTRISGIRGFFHHPFSVWGLNDDESACNQLSIIKELNSLLEHGLLAFDSLHTLFILCNLCNPNKARSVKWKVAECDRAANMSDNAKRSEREKLFTVETNVLSKRWRNYIHRRHSEDWVIEDASRRFSFEMEILSSCNIMNKRKLHSKCSKSFQSDVTRATPLLTNLLALFSWLIGSVADKVNYEQLKYLDDWIIKTKEFPDFQIFEE